VLETSDGLGGGLQDGLSGVGPNDTAGGVRIGAGVGSERRRIKGGDGKVGTVAAPGDSRKVIIIGSGGGLEGVEGRGSGGCSLSG
jgi:hypothetical protein